MKLLRTFKWITTILSIISVVLGIFWFAYAIKFSQYEGIEHAGFGVAIGLVFNLLADIVAVISSFGGVILCITENKKVKMVRMNACLCVNVIVGIISLLMFVLILIII